MKFRQRTLCLLLAVLLLLPLLLCSCEERDERPVIAVTIAPLADFVRAVVGEDFRILTLVPSGYSPESYEPTARTMMDFSSAAFFFSIGMPVDEITLIPALGSGTSHISLAAVSRAAYPDLTIDGGRDPHIWLSPKRVRAMLTAITDALVAYAPEREAAYRAGASAYLARLDAAETAVSAALSDAGVTEFIVYHPAFQYLAAEYGLTMHALEEHGSEATAPDMAAMVELARERGIRVIFYQAETDGRQAEAFAHEIGGRAAVLSPLAEDYIGNLETMAAAIAAAKGE